MTNGRTIQILMDDGTVSGIRLAEIWNWSGQALVCPRSLIRELKDWPAESEKPGVYLLLGISDETGKEEVYIGEAENCLVRILRHLSEKDFWSEAIIFTSKEANFHGTYAKYLESELHRLATAAGRYEVENLNEPKHPVLLVAAGIL